MLNTCMEFVPQTQQRTCQFFKDCSYSKILTFFLTSNSDEPVILAKRASVNPSIFKFLKSSAEDGNPVFRTFSLYR